MAETVHVFNASPLILFARAERLDLLQLLGRELWVPETVFREIESGTGRDKSAERVLASGSIRVVADAALDPRVMSWRIDPGETAVVSLAAQHSAVAVLDDLAARRCAKSIGIRLIGTAGIVALLRQREAIVSARELFAELRRHGFYLSDTIQAAILTRIGEGP